MWMDRLTFTCEALHINIIARAELLHRVTVRHPNVAVRRSFTMPARTVMVNDYLKRIGERYEDAARFGDWTSVPLRIPPDTPQTFTRRKETRRAWLTPSVSHSQITMSRTSMRYKDPLLVPCDEAEGPLGRRD
jgi:hypothetical protein